MKHLALTYMVTAMSDQEIADIANKLLDEAFYTRTSLARKIGFSRVKIDRIADEGLIAKYPRVLNSSQSSKVGRASGKNVWGNYFRLKGTPNYEKRA